MNRVQGLHHLAICTTDMKAQIEFFTDKLGMELQALYWMHGVKNAWHGFLRLNDESSIAFVHHPDIASIPTVLGQTHAGNPGANSAGGTMQHLALKVRDHAELLALRDRLRSQGGAVPQPDLATAAGPHMGNYPPGRYERVLSIPDEAMLNSVDNQPPVKPGDGGHSPAGSIRPAP